MAWNQPGTGDHNKNNSQGSSPDLEKMLKALGNISKLFNGTNKSHKSFIIPALILVTLLWILSGIFIVSPAERAVVLQFGQYHTTLTPGFHWIPRFFQSKTTLNVLSISNYSYKAEMLTKDQNIVDVAVSIQYRINNARNYLYHLVNADNSLQQATASALRQVMGNTTLDQVLTSGRALVRQSVMQQLKKVLTLYHAGLMITDVALQPARAPSEVKSAFDDAIKAQEDEQRYQNQAEAYANNVLPIAKGKAKRMFQEAQAYKQNVVLTAKGNIAQFNAVYKVYKHAPIVTKERLYLTTMENILQKSSKIFLDIKNNHQLLYLPLDQLIGSTHKNKITMPNHDLN